MGFVNCTRWLEGRDVPIVKANRRDPLVVLRFKSIRKLVGSLSGGYERPGPDDQHFDQNTGLRP